MKWRVTHIGINGRRRRLNVEARSNRMAMAYVEQLLGDARYLACVHLVRPLHVSHKGKAPNA